MTSRNPHDSVTLFATVPGGATEILLYSQQGRQREPSSLDRQYNRLRGRFMIVSAIWRVGEENDRDQSAGVGG